MDKSKEQIASEIAKESFFNEAHLDECVTKIWHLLQNDLLNLDIPVFIHSEESILIQKMEPLDANNCFEFVEFVTKYEVESSKFYTRFVIGLKGGQHFEEGAFARLMFYGSYLDAVEWAFAPSTRAESFEASKEMLSNIICYNRLL